MAAQENNSQPGVFISYRRADTNPVVRDLKGELVSALGEGRVFYDKEDLKGGDLWKERLRETIRGCSVFVALIGEDWLKAKNPKSHRRRLDERDDPVRTEIEIALEASRSSGLLIIPVLIDKAQMPEAVDLPDSIQNLPDHNGLPLRASGTTAEWNADLQALLACMREKGIVPAEEQAADAWLAQHLTDTTKRFVIHMTASQLRHGAGAPSPYIDLFVVERYLGKKKENTTTDANAGPGFSLEHTIQQAQGPLLLIGEGGSGKTTSLLYLAARAADRTKADPKSPIPIYVSLARLTKIQDMTDLQQLISDSVRQIKDWSELSAFAIRERRRFLFLFDSFNEIPEHLQRTCAVTLQRFVEKHASDHLCLIGSRLVSAIEALGHPPPEFNTFEILRLTPDQVQQFLNQAGLGSLYDKMSQELRDLAGNPFMLFALAQTLIGAPASELPRNKGRLYQKFTRGWMENEEKKRSLEYDYERVKEPLLCFLAKCMTAAGQTALVWDTSLDELLEAELDGIYQRIKRRGGMPESWTVNRCLDEILGDGLLKRVNEQLHFMHQSVQEYFTGLYFARNYPDALADFTPKLSPPVDSLLLTYRLLEVPNHRFVPALLMMVGILDDGTKIIKALEPRNPVLAAAAIASANKVEGSLLGALENKWLQLLPGQGIMACSCLVLASMRNPKVLEALLNVALQPLWTLGIPGVAGTALAKLATPEAIMTEILNCLRTMSNDDYLEQHRPLARLVKDLENARLIDMMFDEWRISAAGSELQNRLQDLMASVSRSLLNQELERIQSEADVARSADATRALSEVGSWKNTADVLGAAKFQELFASLERKHTEQVTQKLTAMTDMDESDLAACLRSEDDAVRSSAAKLAAERRAPVADVIVEELVRRDRGWSHQDFVSALITICGAETSVSKLVEAAREPCRLVGALDQQLASDLTPDVLPDALRQQIENLLHQSNLHITSAGPASDTFVWHLSSTPVIPPHRPVYQIRKSAQGLELYDCNVAQKVYNVLAMIPGEASLHELRRAFEAGDEGNRTVVIECLARRGDQSLPPKLLEQLKSTTSSDFARAALDALEKLRNREGLSLIDHLLVITQEDWSDKHPQWGPAPSYQPWSQHIHQILIALDADSDIQKKLDSLLTSADALARLAATNEFARWFTEKPERGETWKTPERFDRLLQLTLSDPVESVRDGASQALGKLDSDFLKERLATALNSDSCEVHVNAAHALSQLNSEELYPQITKAMREVIESNQALSIRRRAGKVLSAIRGGLDPLHEPIRTELRRSEWERALEVIEETVEVLPEDASLFWWRAYALTALGRLDQAAEAYERAAQLASNVSMIPQALSKTFIKLGDYARAVEAARQAVQISPTDAEAQATLARSSYKAGSIEETVKAATTAVDLDPVHHEAIWLVLLAHIDRGNVAESRSAFQHAMRVRQCLSPGLDESFVPVLLDELDGIDSDNAEISQLVDEIKNALRPNQ